MAWNPAFYSGIPLELNQYTFLRILLILVVLQKKETHKTQFQDRIRNFKDGIFVLGARIFQVIASHLHFDQHNVQRFRIHYPGKCETPRNFHLARSHCIIHSSFLLL